MPSYRGHVFAGMGTYLVVLHLVKSGTPTTAMIIQGLLFCLLGSLFPDIDIKSKGQLVFYKLIFIALVYCLFVWRWDIFATISMLAVMPLLVKHRGIFHQIWFLLIITFGIILLTKAFYKDQEALYVANSLFFFAGSLSHVLLDRLGSKIKRYLR